MNCERCAAVDSSNIIALEAFHACSQVSMSATKVPEFHRVILLMLHFHLTGVQESRCTSRLFHLEERAPSLNKGNGSCHIKRFEIHSRASQLYMFC